MTEHQEQIRLAILRRISEGLPISSYHVQTEDFPELTGDAERRVISNVIKQESEYGGVIFSAPYGRRPQRIAGVIYNAWFPADYVVTEAQAEEEAAEAPSMKEYEDIEIPDEIVSEIFSIGDPLVVYKVPSAKRVVICKRHIDSTLFGEDAELVAQWRLEEFSILLKARWIDDVGIQDLHLAFLKLPDQQGMFLALMNEPGFDATDGRYLRIPVANIRQMGWERGQTIYLYKNTSIRELLLSDSPDMVHFRPVANYTVHADGAMQIPMRWLYGVDIHENHTIRLALNIGDGALIICPDDDYHRQIYIDTPIERVGADADFDEYDIPF